MEFSEDNTFFDLHNSPEMEKYCEWIKLNYTTESC